MKCVWMSLWVRVWMSECAVMEVREEKKMDTRRTVRLIYCSFSLALATSRLVSSCFLALFRIWDWVGLGTASCWLVERMLDCCPRDGRQEQAPYVTISKTGRQAGARSAEKERGERDKYLIGETRTSARLAPTLLEFKKRVHPTSPSVCVWRIVRPNHAVM